MKPAQGSWDTIFGMGLLGFACLIGLMPTLRAEEPSALQVFENFRKVYAQTKTFSAEFTETTLMDGQKRAAKGRLVFQKPNLLNQEYFDPKDPKTVAQRIVLDGKTSWSYTPWLNQVVRKELDPKSSKELLPGAGESLERLPDQYAITLKEDAASKAKAYLLELKPKPDASGKTTGESLEVWIRKTDWLPIQIAYKNKPNDVTTIVSFDSLKLNVTPPKDAFVFTPPAGIEVVTMTDEYKTDK